MLARAFLFLLASGIDWTGGEISSEKLLCPPVSPPRRGSVSCLRANDAVSCTRKSSPGSVALFRCREYYRLEGEGSRMCLSNGTWTSPYPRCLPDCGRRTSSVSLMVNGLVATPGSFPWHVAIYNYFGGEHVYWCGGSLISEYAVLTAAHCVWNIPPERLTLAFGKFNREFQSDEQNVQKLKAKKIEKLESYQDLAGNYNGDVCLIVLERPVHLGYFSAPICLDWDQKFVDKHLAEGSVGLVLGWGLTENETFSDHLRMLRLPVMSDRKCIAHQDRDFRKFVTYTTFCAGFGNGTGVCNGDSGGGLAFFDEDSGRWYLQGVVSVSPRRTGTPYCDPRFYTVFTKVAVFSKWLKRIGLFEEEPTDGNDETTSGKAEGRAPEGKEKKTNSDLYAFVRKYFEKQVQEVKGSQVAFPHSQKMLRLVGML